MGLRTLFKKRKAVTLEEAAASSSASGNPEADPIRLAEEPVTASGPPAPWAPASWHRGGEGGPT